jgi:TP901 family phage tail tape measure protein
VAGDTIAHLVVSLEVDAARFAAGLAQAEGRAQRTGGFLASAFAVATGGLITSAITGIAGGLAALGSTGVQGAADLQQTLNLVQVSAGATAQEMQQLGALAQQLGSDVQLPGTSAADAASAMLELNKAGVSLTDTMDAAKGVLQLSAAAQVDNATAAAITAGALNAFGLAGSEAGRVADLLAAGANESAASIADLSAGLQQGAFAFDANNQSIESLVASLGILTNVGLTGSDAGTALKNAMMKLAAPTEQGAKMMQQLGIDVFDAAGNMLPLRDIIGIFNTQMADLTAEERNAALSTILLGDGMKAMIPLLNQGVDGFDAMVGAVSAQGAAGDMAAAQSAGLNGALDGLKSTWETVSSAMAQPVLPLLEQGIRGVTTVLGDMQPALVGGATAVAGVISALADAGPASSEFQEALSVITGDTLAAGIVTVVGAIQQVVGALGAAAQGDTSGLLMLFPPQLQPIVATVLGAMQQAVPIVQQVVAAIASAAGGDGGAGLLALFPPEIQGVITSVIGVLGQVGSSVATIVGIIAANGPAIAAQFMAMFTTAYQTVMAVVPPIYAVVVAVLGQVAAFLAANGPQIAGFFLQTWSQVSTIVQTALQLVAAVVVPILTGVASFVAAHGQQIQTYLLTAWNLVTGIVTTALGLIQGLITTALQIIQGDWSGAWSTLTQTSATFVLGIVDIFTNAGSLLVQAWQLTWETVKATFGGFVTDALAFGNDVIQGVAQGVQNAAGAVVSAITGAVGRGIAAAKQLLGIRSPSRVAAEEVGAPVGEGVAVGMEGTAEQIAAAGADLGAAAVTSATVAAEQAGAAATGIQDKYARKSEELAIRQAQKREEIEREHQERLAEIAEDGAAKMAAAEQAFGQAQREGRLGFYKGLADLAMSDDAGDQQLAAQMAAQYEAAAQQAAQLTATVGADVGKEYLAAARQAIEDEAQIRQQIAAAQADGKDTSYLQGLLAMQQEYNQAVLSEIQNGGSAIAAEQARQYAEEERRYQEHLASLEADGAAAQAKIDRQASADGMGTVDTTQAGGARPTGRSGALAESGAQNTGDLIQTITGTSGQQSALLEQILGQLKALTSAVDRASFGGGQGVVV